MTPDDLPTPLELADAEYRLNIAYRYPNGVHVTRQNIKLIKVKWMRKGLLLVVNFGPGWCDMEFRWKNLLMCEWAGVRA